MIGSILSQSDSGLCRTRPTEPNANNALAGLLRPMLSGCQVRSENTQVMVDQPGLRPDILITAPRC